MPNLHSEIKKAVEHLKAGNLILFPTDTFWSVGCDATNSNAVEKLYNLKQSDNRTSITCLVADDRMLCKYIEKIPFAAQTIIDVTNQATTIIYDAPKNISPNLIPANNTLAMRIPDDEFCYQLTRKLNGAIAISHAHVNGENIPKSFQEIATPILKGVDYIVNLQQDKICTKPAAIIKINNSSIVKVLRK